jgi:hypothetical protein
VTGTLAYILPLRWDDDDDFDDLNAYLNGLAPLVELIVVDGSPEPLASRHRLAWEPLGVWSSPDRDLGYRNGKVNGVMTGVRRATSPRLLIADDDVRHTAETLHRIALLLDDHDIVRPQNLFDPLPWHAWWDTGRSLTNRALGADFPGTLGVRRKALEATGGYDGDVLFENLELIRTVRAAGGREARPSDLFVARRPPSVRLFVEQRVRQAYDDFAVPVRLAAFLALLPAVAFVPRRRRLLGTLAGVSLGLAELGRRRGGLCKALPWWVTLAGPVWLTERAVCSWLAVGQRLLYGGVRYRGSVLSRAATSRRDLAVRHGQRPLRRTDAPSQSGITGEHQVAD